MKNIFVFLAFMALISCSTPKVINLHAISKPIDDVGVMFSLPKTILKVEVNINRTTLHKGPFAEFADKYFGLQNVITSEQTTYSIGDVNVTTLKEADSTQLYFISNLPHRFKIDFDEYGLLNSINTFGERKEIHKNIRIEQDDNINLQSDLFRNYAENNLVEKIDTITEEVHADTASFLKQTLKKTLIAKPMTLRVEEAADYILKVRQSRLNILSATSEVAFEKASIKYMADELLKIENEYMTLFTGIVDKQMETYTYYVEPLANQDVYPLFVFSNAEGIVKKGGEKSFPIELKITAEKTYSKVTEHLSSKHFQKGFPYRMPENLEITVSSPYATLTNIKLAILQRGVVYRLPFGNHSRMRSRPNGTLEFIKY